MLWAAKPILGHARFSSVFFERSTNAEINQGFSLKHQVCKELDISKKQRVYHASADFIGQSAAQKFLRAGMFLNV